MNLDKGIKVEILDTDTNIATHYDSIRQAATFLNCHLKTLLEKENISNKSSNNSNTQFIIRGKYLIKILRPSNPTFYLTDVLYAEYKTLNKSTVGKESFNVHNTNLEISEDILSKDDILKDQGQKEKHQYETLDCKSTEVLDVNLKSYPNKLDLKKARQKYKDAFGIKIVVKNVLTGSSTEYNSISEASKEFFLKIERKTIRNYISSKKIFKNIYSFSL